MSPVDVLRVAIGNGVLRELHSTLIILKDRYMHGMPTSANVKRQTCLRKSTSFITSASATYSACVVESVTHFCVLENQDTQAPPHITNPLETGILSAALLV